MDAPPVYYIDIYDRFDIDGNALTLQKNTSPEVFIKNSYSALDLYEASVLRLSSFFRFYETINYCDESVCYLYDGKTVDLHVVIDSYKLAIDSLTSTFNSTYYAIDTAYYYSQDDIDNDYKNLMKKREELTKTRKDLDEMMQKFNIKKTNTQSNDFLISDDKYQMDYVLYTQTILIILLCSILFMFFTRI